MITNDSQLSAVLETVVDGIITIDDKGVIELFNPAAERIFGYKASEVLGTNIKNLMPEPDRSKHNGYMEQYLLTGKASIIGIGREVAGLKKNGTVFPLDLAVSQFFVGEVSKFTGIVRDISQRKIIEQEKENLLHSAQRANEELKDFAYIVSHDLKAPLRGISSLAQWLVEDHAEQLGESGQEQARLLIDRTERMHRLVEGILEYSRVGREQHHITTLNSGEIAQQVVDSLVIPSEVEVQIETPMPVISYNQIHMVQLFQNLINNAITHMGEKGNKIGVSCSDSGDYWEFCVKDNGIGIKKEYQERIFKIFQTLYPSDYEKSTGLGLSIVKKIAETHGGMTRVESTEGKGSSFFFSVLKQRK